MPYKGKWRNSVSFTTLAYGIDVMVNTEKVMFDNDSGKPFIDTILYRFKV